MAGGTRVDISWIRDNGDRECVAEAMMNQRL